LRETWKEMCSSLAAATGLNSRSKKLKMTRLCGARGLLAVTTLRGGPKGEGGSGGGGGA
jgi:hypothetical protein